jgi:hypothetical protein
MSDMRIDPSSLPAQIRVHPKSCRSVVKLKASSGVFVLFRLAPPVAADDLAVGVGHVVSETPARMLGQKVFEAEMGRESLRGFSGGHLPGRARSST